MDSTRVRSTVQQLWQAEILPSLSEFVAIPALSPVFDEDWARSGQLDAAVEHLRGWLEKRGVPGATAEIVRLPGRSPILLFDVPAIGGGSDEDIDDTVLLYGHLDKQPPVGGWSEGLGPWTPVVRDGKLFGRGAADDGYAGYAAAAAIEAVHAAGGRHAHCVVLLETGEESGSVDLPAYLELLAERLGQVSLVVCLDSGGQDYERMWLTTSLRGVVTVTVTVRVLESAQHSGMASGIVPSSFRILRQLLDRIEDPVTGEVLLPEMHGAVPDERIAEMRALAAALPGAARAAFPMLAGMVAVAEDDVELMMNNSWRPTLSVIGAAGLPLPAEAGNVLRPSTTLTLSFRLPPTADPETALVALQRVLTTDVPYGAHVELTRAETGGGWNAPPTAPWLRSTLDTMSETVFGGNTWQTMRLGGSIPLMGMLAEAYPAAQFVVTGALGADSNAHVPDEWLHLAQAERVTEAVAAILHAHAHA